jgi:hypothetical protein
MSISKLKKKIRIVSLIPRHSSKKNAQVWISAILYMLIAATAMALIIQAGLPIISNMKDRSVYTRTEDMLMDLDSQIAEVASEGEGSQRVVPIELRDGEITIKDGKLYWEFETETKIFEPKSRVNVGNLVITTNAGVNAFEYNNSYILENKYIIVNISKIDGDIDTSELINYIEFKSNSKKTNGTFSFTIGDDDSSGEGTGKTSIKETGTNLGFATVVAKVSSDNFEYNLELTLESEADFIRVNVKDLIVK